jgi:hypothetical protein
VRREDFELIFLSTNRIPHFAEPAFHADAAAVGLDDAARNR